MGASGLTEVRRRIAAAATRVGRDPDEIDLVVVTKYASDPAVRAILSEGVTRLGESRAGGIERRAGSFPDVEWHFIGHLQRNKVNRVRPVTDVLHSMDRDRLARAWARRPDPPPVYVQVDLAGETQKGGVAPGGVPGLLALCAELEIEVRGLMTIPPRGRSPEDARRWFDELRALRDRVAGDHDADLGLSMGMSDDFEVAVEEGATILRVGRAILEPLEDDED
jgi:pyridoxal phosphate enzyme (YggS family)